jgi:hypothetical protein
MQLAPPVVSPVPYTRAVGVAPTGAAQVPSPTPAAELYRKRGLDILQLPGAYSLSWGMTTPNELALNVYTEADAAALAMFLEPVIDGVKLVLRYGADRTPFTGQPTGFVNDMLRAIAGLPGVWNIDKRAITINGGYARVQTINQATIDRLNPLVKDRLDFGTTPKGVQRWLALRWVAGIPA